MRAARSVPGPAPAAAAIKKCKNKTETKKQLKQKIKIISREQPGLYLGLRPRLPRSLIFGAAWLSPAAHPGTPPLFPFFVDHLFIHFISFYFSAAALADLRCSLALSRGAPRHALPRSSPYF